MSLSHELRDLRGVLHESSCLSVTTFLKCNVVYLQMQQRVLATVNVSQEA